MTRTPGSPLTTTAQQLVDEANSRITTLTRDEVLPLLDDPGTLLVDIRDVRELEREGTIPGAKHAPRGMLEFWIDPASPYHKPELDDGRRLVLFGAAGSRTDLRTQLEARLRREVVAHLDGGFSGWKKAGLPVAERAPKA